jgi:hypothetical protein
MPALQDIDKQQLDSVVHAIQTALSEESMRALSQRAVQAKIWHLQPQLAEVLSQLRAQEETVRGAILQRISQLVYRFHEHTLDTTLARAGVVQDTRVHAGSSLEKKESFDIVCLDSKERLYVLLKFYGFIEDCASRSSVSWR